MELSAAYVHSEVIGYGRMGVNIVKALRDMNVAVYDDLGHPDTPVEEGRERKATNVSLWLSVPSHARGWLEGQHTAVLSMFESNRLPEAFRENLHEFDTVMVPSPQNVEMFGAYHDNVHLVTLGIDPTRWHLTQRPEPGAFFDFLIGGSGERKGIDVARAAFLQAFPDRSWGNGPIPRLVMKSPRSLPYEGFEPHERIQVVSGHLSAADEVALYAASHCYVQPSRGEGFGLQPLQALAQGMPTILTDAHGHQTFAHLGYGIEAKLVPAGYFIYGDPGEWWEPDVEQVADRMRYVYDNYETACVRGFHASQVVREEFTWHSSANQVLDAIGRENLLKPYSGSGGWHKADLRLYLAMVNRDWTADIAGTTYVFQRGVETWVPADVKRILFDAGLLHADCLTPALRARDAALDLGLTQAQVESLSLPQAAHGYCPTCGQRENSQPTRSDDIYAGMAS